jgi:hypothetical protein
MGKTGEMCQPVIRTASKVIPTVLATRVVDVEESDGRDRGELNRTLRRVGVGEVPGDALVREEELEGYGAGRLSSTFVHAGSFWSWCNLVPGPEQIPNFDVVVGEISTSSRELVITFGAIRM